RAAHPRQFDRGSGRGVQPVQHGEPGRTERRRRKRGVRHDYDRPRSPRRPAGGEGAVLAFTGPAPASSSIRRVFLLAWVLAPLLGLLQPAAKPLEVYFIDVEGGQATLIVT